MYIDCFRVTGSFKGHGYSNDLLSKCIEGSKAKGKSGLCILSSAKKKPFLSDPKHLAYKGFKVADVSDAGINLMYLLQLSGGQQQRAAIARALASEAKVLLAGEPTGNLGENTAEEIIELLIKTAHELGKCVIIVPHSKRLADEADVIIQIKDGMVQSEYSHYD